MLITLTLIRLKNSDDFLAAGSLRSVANQPDWEHAACKAHRRTQGEKT